MHRNQQGSFLIYIMITLLLVVSIALGFFVGALTDPNRNADIRASASNFVARQKVVKDHTCKPIVRWYTFDLFCR